MVNFGEKDKIKKAGILNSGHSYVITTVTKQDQLSLFWILEVPLTPQGDSGQRA